MATNLKQFKNEDAINVRAEYINENFYEGEFTVEGVDGMPALVTAVNDTHVFVRGFDKYTGYLTEGYKIAIEDVNSAMLYKGVKL